MPLGLEPDIILAGRPAQIEQPLDQLRKVAQLRQEQQNLAMGPARLQNLQADTRLATTRANDAETEAADHEAFHAAMVQSGSDPDKMLEIGRNTIRNPAVLSQLENHASEIRKRDADTKGKNHKEFADKARMFADRFQAILETKDPEVQKQLWADAAARVNDLKDENGKLLLGDQKLDSSTLPAPEMIQGLQTYADSAAGYHTRLADQKKAKEDQNIKDDADRKREADNRQSQRAEAANLFETVTDQESYTAWRDKLPDGIRGEYPNKYNPVGKDNTPDLVRRKGRTIPQQDQADNRAVDKNISDLDVAREWAEEHFKGKNVKREVVLDAALNRVAALRREGKVGGDETPKPDKVQQRQWMNGYTTATDKERDLSARLGAVEDAIKGNYDAKGEAIVGKGIYINKDGKSTPITESVKDEKEIPTRVNEMKIEANKLREEIAGTISKKYENAERLGFTGSVPVGEATRKVIEGKWALSQQQGQVNAGQSKQATAPPAQQQPASARPANPYRKAK